MITPQGRRLVLVIAGLAIAAVLFEGGLIHGTAVGAQWTAVEPDRDRMLAELAEASPDVAAALADGTVDVNEVRAALAETVACMTAAGVVVEQAEFTEDGHVRMRWSGGTTVGSADAADAAHERCFLAHAEPLAAAYGAERQPSAVDMERYFDAVMSCIETGGHPIGTVAEIDDVEDRQLVRGCRRQAEATTFGG